MLFDQFPREFGEKRLFIKNKQDMLEAIRKYNGLINCFTTVYSIPRPRAYGEAVIDKLFFDIDPEHNSSPWDSTKLLHKKLQGKGLRHCIFFSGGGFHIYVFTKPHPADKNTLKRAQLEILGNIKSDNHVIGDIARITRIPNTWNPKRQRYCIPLRESDFGLFYEEVKALATKPQLHKVVFEGDLLDLNTFVRDKQYERIILDVSQEVYPNDDTFNEYVKLLPPIVQKLLLNHRDGWQDRYIQILGFRDSGVPMNIGIQVASKFWSQEKLYHCVYEERQFEYVYGRADLNFPNWDTLANKGYIITEEDRKVRLYV